MMLRVLRMVTLLARCKMATIISVCFYKIKPYCLSMSYAFVASCLQKKCPEKGVLSLWHVLIRCKP
ncbi:protein of unknown function [Acidithiobacillus ferrivorans]|uniref:Secreted protein n=1 Tax=Acidithiobacillus ferrivorans TaxID=160808 RepID=A0ABY1MJP2_9PROT|nr:protein of unknown function [Acidithiobacillus ferrivorans]